MGSEKPADKSGIEKSGPRDQSEKSLSSLDKSPNNISVENSFEKSAKKESYMQGSNQMAVVIIDEIGLAENSPHNPLKVLHKPLEHPKTSIGNN